MSMLFLMLSFFYTRHVHAATTPAALPLKYQAARRENSVRFCLMFAFFMRKNATALKFNGAAPFDLCEPVFM